MEAQARKKRKAQSPYQKYKKQPYQYTFYGCKHSRAERQSVAASRELPDGWRGEVCASCNVIIKNFTERPARAPFLAEAA